jgi:hypothetical protein
VVGDVLVGLGLGEVLEGRGLGDVPPADGEGEELSGCAARCLEDGRVVG